VFTSANGQVLSMCEADDDIRALFFASDLINADGMPLVFASQFLSDHKLPERVATTDLIYEVAEIAQGCGATFYLLGAAAPRNDHAELSVVRTGCALLVVTRL
jgi:N-acetylglucosaminyldiphosphoundecaprenol N-acetyl-beta-D-mannosaminyltransferase